MMFDRKRWFNGEIKTLDELIDTYINRGIKVFNEGVFEKDVYLRAIKEESDSNENK